MCIRINEYAEAFDKNLPGKSTFAAHLMEYGHSGGTEVLHSESRKRRRLAFDCMEIARHCYHHESVLINKYIPGDLFIEKIIS